MTDVFYLTIDALGSAYRARSLSPVEVVAATLARIERLDPTLQSYVTVCGDAAMSAARDSQARFGSGTPRGPLDGIPIGLKGTSSSTHRPLVRITRRTRGASDFSWERSRPRTTITVVPARARTASPR